MIDKVRVLNALGIDKTLTFSNAYNGIKIRNITGLGPVAAEFNNSRNSNGVGVNHTSSYIGQRNIVFSLGLSDTKENTVEDLRHNLYLYFPIGQIVELRFETDRGDIRQIFGRVESVEPELFTKDPSLQVSIMCEYPYFYAYQTDENKVTLLATSPSVVNYQGRINNGMIIDILVTAPMPSETLGTFSFVQKIVGLPDRQFQIEDQHLITIANTKLLPGDRLRISTIRGKKAAKFTHANSERNVIGALRAVGGILLPEDQWPEFFVGKESSFSYSSTVYDPTQIQVTISWDVLIEGL